MLSNTLAGLQEQRWHTHNAYYINMHSVPSLAVFLMRKYSSCFQVHKISNNLIFYICLFVCSGK